MIVSLVLALIVLGFFSVFLSTTIGGGAGIVLVPILILVFGLSANVSIATSLAAMTLGAFFSTAAYSRQGFIDYRIGIPLAVLALPGAILGAFISTFLQGTKFELMLGIVIMSIAVSTLVGLHRKVADTKTSWSGRISGNSRSNINYTVNRNLVIVGAIITGFFAGTFGAAGGLILTPVMIVAGFPIQIALGTIRLVSLGLGLGATVTRLSLGQVDTSVVLWLSLGAVGGAILGARLVGSIKTERLNWIVSIGIFILGLILAVHSV